MSTSYPPHTLMRLLLSSMLATASLLTAPLLTAPAHAQSQCVTGNPATPAAVELQASLADAYRELGAFATGAGVRVAVIDTGISPHPRLPAIADGGDFVDADRGGPLDDCDGHGTIVASVLAARDTGDGIRGIAPDVEIVSIRQTTAQQLMRSESGGTLASLIAAVQAALEADVDVINLSLAACIPRSVTIDLHPLQEILAQAEARNVVIVAAAGNHSQHCDSAMRIIPAEYDTVVAVTAHDASWQLADYALTPPGNYISARGEVAAALSFDTAGTIESTGSPESPAALVGTSFATPLVSGTAALLTQRYPQETAAQLRSRLYDAADGFHYAFSPARALLTPGGRDITAYHVPEFAHAPETTVTTAADSAADTRTSTGTTREAAVSARSLAGALVLATLSILRTLGLRRWSSHRR